MFEKSSGHQILDTATINYVNKLKFLPAEYKGKYKSVWITMLVKFSFE
ncbi:MAG: TonB family protein [Ignavibacteriales bacterium]|nr:TonB family protein [Ignavibacteriales bacterium]